MSETRLQPGQTGPTIQPPPRFGVSPMTPPRQEEEPIGLIGDQEAAAAEGKIKAIGVGAGGSVRREQYQRNCVNTGQGACRVRSFHGRLSAQGLEYLDNQINEWLDHSPEVDIKLVTTNVGVFEGKMREPALIVNVWY